VVVIPDHSDCTSVHPTGSTATAADTFASHQSPAAAACHFGQ